MKIVISPAKKMKVDTDSLPCRDLPEFLSNAEEEAKLASSDYQKALAAVIAAAVGSNLG